MEQIVDIPVGGDLQDFLPDHGLSATSAVSRDEAFQWVFRTFPRVWTPAAYEAKESLSAFEHEYNDVHFARQWVPA